ncbi:MAG: radical SAM protein [Dehalococcoidia bacterium]|nr:MAG: radical SAM protein [Dehalococcoidia bacterium]
MISITRLLCDNVGPGDYLRYEKKEQPRPVVVWNCTRQCNLRCIHCYASAKTSKAPGELDNASAKKLIRDLADFGVPVILFSGGEPLMRVDLFELAQYARELGIRVALSTNGTLITPEAAEQIRQIGFAEVGVSLDGIGANHDRFRGKSGAFQEALGGIRNCVALGLRVSLRLTMTRYNYQEIPAILKLTEDEGINRICFYHLAYAGRGGNLQAQDLTHAESRAVVDTICEQALSMHRRGLPKEILTVGNHADGVYLYLRLRKQDPERASRMLDLLRINGGNNAGVRIGAVDGLGNVHPDQFWQQAIVGNVRERKFGEIWSDPSQPLLAGLRERKKLLEGRCARCQYLDLCNGNLRVRAEAAYGNAWAEDPACYLSDEEIGIIS